MVSPTLRENRAASTAHYARFTESGTVDVPGVSPAPQQEPATCWTAVRPVSGTPLWARPGPDGGRAAVPPWEEWPRTPQDPARFTAKLAAVREPSTQRSYAWRVGFEKPKVAEPVAAASVVKVAPQGGKVAVVTSQTPAAALRKRVALILGFAYLLLYALASGLALPLIADPESERPEGDEPSENPTPATTPPLVDYRPRPHPRPDPHEPGLHVRPDGSRYLVVPLNFAGAVA